VHCSRVPGAPSVRHQYRRGYVASKLAPSASGTTSDPALVSRRKYSIGQCFYNRVPQNFKVPQNIVRGSERNSGIDT
jgi:hypothetical protein